MANVVNLNAEVGANFIADDTSAGLVINNTGTGAALSTEKLSLDSNILAANATVGIALTIRGASVASGAVLKFSPDALVSCTTIQFITGGVNGTKALRVAVGDGTFAWIPLLPSAAVTGAAL